MPKKHFSVFHFCLKPPWLIYKLSSVICGIFLFVICTLLLNRVMKGDLLSLSFPCSKMPQKHFSVFHFCLKPPCLIYNLSCVICGIFLFVICTLLLNRVMKGDC